MANEVTETPVKTKKARAKRVKDAVVAAAPKVEDAVNDVTEVMKTELEEIIAEKVPQAPENTALNKALRNAAIAIVLVLVAAAAWNFLF